MKTVIVSLLLLTGLAACGQNDAVTAPAETESAALAEASATADALAAEAAAEFSDDAAGDEAEADVSPAEVYFIEPADGAEVTNPVMLRFGLKGMEVAPAGTMTANTGHHHLLIDVTELPAMDQPIPADEQHRHFGKGQTEVSLELSPGEHTLQLLLGDGSHVPHQPALLSVPITITVVE